MVAAAIYSVTLAVAARRLQNAAGCPCLTSAPSGTRYPTFTLAGQTITYDNGYGLTTCSAHDTGLQPYCNRGGESPSWCADSWCYVDANNCNKPSSKSVYFPELRYSYFTCGNANTFDSWFGTPTADAGSGEVTVTHQLTELVDLMQKYTKTISE